MKAVRFTLSICVVVLCLYAFLRERPGGQAELAGVGAGDATQLSAVDRAVAPVPPSPARVESAPEPAPGSVLRDWSDAVDPAAEVPLEQAWGFDLSQVDFEADPLCRVGGVDITRRDLRRWTCLTLGGPLVEARLLAYSGEHAARARGLPFGLSDAEFEACFEAWCQSKELALAEGRRALSSMLRLPPAAALRARRDALEAVIALFSPDPESGEPPREMQLALARQTGLPDLAPLYALLYQARRQPSKPESARNLMNAVEALALYLPGLRAEERLRRQWTWLDHELPGDAVGACTFGVWDETRLTPPWELPGESRRVDGAELWRLLEPMLSREVLEQELRELIWVSVLRARLSAQGALPSPEASWLVWAQAEQAGRKALFGPEALALMYQGFPAPAVYRAATAVRRGFQASLPDGDDGEPELRAFFARNRLHIQRWLPEIDIALFPPRDPQRSPAAGQAWPADWEAARDSAEEFRAKLARGSDFETLLQSHNQTLARAMQLTLSDQAATDFAQRFRAGSAAQAPSQIEEQLRETRWRRWLDGTSLLRNAMARLKAGEPSPAWRAPVGYLVVRVRGVRPIRETQDFEQLREETREELLESRFLQWLNRELQQANFEPAR